MNHFQWNWEWALLIIIGDEADDSQAESVDRQASNLSNESKENAENSRLRKILINSNKDHIISRECKVVAK